MTRVISIIIAAALALLGACAENVRGRIEAQGQGDLIEPPLGRVDPTAPMREACGPAMEASMLREPYLQQLTARGARVLWVSAREAPETVVVSRALDEVARFDAEVVPTEALAAGVQRRARIGGLEPATIYCYTLTLDDEVVYGPVGFRTAPAPGDVRRVDVLAFGDSGDGGADQLALTAQMYTVPADVIVHMGDLVYPSGSMVGLELFVFDVYEDLLESIPFYPTFGNHDLETDHGAPYFEAFELPENGAVPERYYSFDYGHVHFVSLDTDDMTREQAEWLDADLDANVLPWTIVYGHVPPFSNGYHGGSGTYRERFLEAIRRHRVQLVLAGHDHHYERIEPGDGVTYVITGAGGYSTRSVSPDASTRYAEPVTHLVSIHVEEDELRLYAVDATGVVFDSARITR